MTMGQLYQNHLDRINRIKMSVKVEEFWEVEYDLKLKNQSNFREFVENQKIRSPIEPRDSLFGGRVNASILFFEGEANYVDFNSLYPYVQKYKKFPHGHLTIITEFTSKDTQSYFGLVKCRVLPPRNFFFQYSRCIYVKK